MENYEPILKRLEKTAKQYTNIAPENGQFLSILIRAIQAQNVLEVGLNEIVEIRVGNTLMKP